MLFSQVSGRKKHTEVYLSCHIAPHQTKYFSSSSPHCFCFEPSLWTCSDVLPPRMELIGKTIDCILGIPGLRSSPNLRLAISFFQQLSCLSTEVRSKDLYTNIFTLKVESLQIWNDAISDLNTLKLSAKFMPYYNQD